MDKFRGKYFRVTKMTESDIELMAIEQLEGLGYTYVYGPEIESKGINPLRSYKQVILEPKGTGGLATSQSSFEWRQVHWGAEASHQSAFPRYAQQQPRIPSFAPLKASTLKWARMVTPKVNMLGWLTSITQPITNFWSSTKSPSKKIVGQDDQTWSCMWMAYLW